MRHVTNRVYQLPASMNILSPYPSPATEHHDSVHML